MTYQPPEATYLLYYDGQIMCVDPKTQVPITVYGWKDGAKAK